MFGRAVGVKAGPGGGVLGLTAKGVWAFACKVVPVSGVRHCCVNGDDVFPWCEWGGWWLHWLRSLPLCQEFWVCCFGDPWRCRVWPCWLCCGEWFLLSHLSVVWGPNVVLVKDWELLAELFKSLLFQWV